MSIGGISMGSMGEGGGNEFFMGGMHEEPEEDYQSEEQEPKNPELETVESMKEKTVRDRRQSLEDKITGRMLVCSNPWSLLPAERPESMRQNEQEAMRIPEAQSDNSGERRLMGLNA